MIQQIIEISDIYSLKLSVQLIDMKIWQYIRKYRQILISKVGVPLLSLLLVHVDFLCCQRMLPHILRLQQQGAERAD